MNNRFDKVKDILYDFSDYLIMAGIVLSIVFIIGWRLDILFPKTIAMVNEKDTPEIEKEIDKKVDANKDKPIEVADKDKKDDIPEAEDKADSEKLPEIIKVSIPKGTHSAGIGSILMDNGLIESTKDFQDKITELDLEKKLRSGEYDIAKDESLESIAKIIANQK